MMEKEPIDDALLNLVNAVKIKILFDVEEIAEVIEKHLDRIYVREQVDGKWGTFSLAELPNDLAIKHVCRFFKKFRKPVYMTSDETHDCECEIPNITKSCLRCTRCGGITPNRED